MQIIPMKRVFFKQGRFHAYRRAQHDVLFQYGLKVNYVRDKMGPQKRLTGFVDEIIRGTGKLCFGFFQQLDLLFQLVLKPDIIAVKKSDIITIGRLNASISGKSDAFVPPSQG